MDIFKPFNERTEIESLNFPFNISYDTQSLFLGSCFSENIGSQLKQLKFPTLINPFGAIYNPASIFKTLQIIIENKLFSLSHLNKPANNYFSYFFNTDFSSSNPDELLQLINENIKKSNRFFIETDVVFVTLGTAYVFELVNSGEIVSNCHKQPANFFTRKLLKIQEIEGYLNNIINSIGSDKKVVFTVSPIRHLKDGLVENQKSKSMLIAALHNIIQQHENAYYFPAYEIVLDDLRDYRFYDESLTHINETGKHYIFQKFIESFIEIKDVSIMKDVDKLNKMLNHKVNNESIKKEWNQKVSDFLNVLEKKYPFIDFSDERALIL